MITDHTAVNKQAVALVTKLHVTPEENDTSKALNSIDKVLIPNAKNADKSFDSGAIKQNKSWRYTVHKKGQLSYSCTFHPTMKGILIVK